MIEALMVMVIIGLLAAITIPKFVNTKSRAYAASSRSDLSNLSTLQELYFYTHREYASDMAAAGMVAGNGGVVTIMEATPSGWSATTSHPATPVVCSVFYGSAAPLPPAVTPGMIDCR